MAGQCPCPSNKPSNWVCTCSQNCVFVWMLTDTCRQSQLLPTKGLTDLEASTNQHVAWMKYWFDPSNSDNWPLQHELSSTRWHPTLKWSRWYSLYRFQSMIDAHWILSHLQMSQLLMNVLILFNFFWRQKVLWACLVCSYTRSSLVSFSRML